MSIAMVTLRYLTPRRIVSYEEETYVQPVVILMLLTPMQMSAGMGIFHNFMTYMCQKG